jgi:hypothetical protein
MPILAHWRLRADQSLLHHLGSNDRADYILSLAMNSVLIGFAIGMIIILIVIVSRSQQKNQSFLDYMPTAVEPCPSHYKCGATSRAQVRLENNLFNDLRESNTFTLPETITTDQYDVIASEAEPTACMIRRAAQAHEGRLGEGQYTPYDEIEERFLTRRPKEASVTQLAVEKAAESMTSTEKPIR